MAHTYTALTVEHRCNIIDQRIASLEADHFAHELNKAALASLPASKEKADAVAAASEAQKTLEGAIAAAASEKAKLTAAA